MDRTYDGRLPPSSYLMALALFAWGLVMAWIAFGGTDESRVSLTAATLFLLVFFGLPGLMTRIRDFTARRTPVRRRDGKVETETGPVEPETARFEMLIPVMSIALGFTLLGVVFLAVTLGL